MKIINIKYLSSIFESYVYVKYIDYIFDMIINLRVLRYAISTPNNTR